MLHTLTTINRLLEIHWEIRGEKLAMLEHRKILSRVWQILLGREYMLFPAVSAVVHGPYSCKYGV